MEYNDLVPLYKILCLALIFLVPLLPAWGLYKIAPNDRFLATGTFSGFKINAAGSAAIYIVLFAASYVQTNSIMKQIDKTTTFKKQIDSLTNQVVSLTNNRPWKVLYDVTLMSADSLHQIDPVTFSNNVNGLNVICSPAAFHVTDQMVSFYIDAADEQILPDSINGAIEVNGFCTSHFQFPKSGHIDLNAHTIKLSPKVYMGRAKAAQLDQVNHHDHSVIVLNHGTAAPPHG